MNESAIQVAMSEARACASTMLHASQYMKKELSGSSLASPLRMRIAGACDALAGTKHDIDTELEELGELLAGRADEAVLRRRLERIARWLREDVDRMHGLVTAFDAEPAQVPAVGLAFVLVAESAAGILKAYTAVQDAVWAALGKTRAGNAA